MRREAEYLTIQHFHQERRWSVRWMCKQLGVSKAGYYKWRHRTVPKVEQENLHLAELIREYDDSFSHILGYRRMTSWINHFNGTNYCKNRVHRIMKALNIRSVIRKKRRKYQRSTPDAIAENSLRRDFTATRPNEKWATDVTEFKWYEGPAIHKLYLSAIIDLYDRSIISHVISRRNDNKLVFDTFDKAIAENPNARPLFHSDRGYQYTSRLFRMKLRCHEMAQSMSRAGHCIDNGPIEGFWGIVKAEMFYLHRFTDEASLRLTIENYIQFYNCERLQERFGHRTPVEVRLDALRAITPT